MAILFQLLRTIITNFLEYSGTYLTTTTIREINQLSNANLQQQTTDFVTFYNLIDDKGNILVQRHAPNKITRKQN